MCPVAVRNTANKPPARTRTWQASWIATPFRPNRVSAEKGFSQANESEGCSISLQNRLQAIETNVKNNEHNLNYRRSTRILGLSGTGNRQVYNTVRRSRQ